MLNEDGTKFSLGEVRCPCRSAQWGVAGNELWLTRCRLQLDLTSSEVVSLEGLEQELAKYANHEARSPWPGQSCELTFCSQVVRDILRSEGAELRQRASAVEGKLHQARDIALPRTRSADAASGSVLGGAGLHPGLRRGE